MFVCSVCSVCVCVVCGSILGILKGRAPYHIRQHPRHTEGQPSPGLLTVTPSPGLRPSPSLPPSLPPCLPACLSACQVMIFPVPATLWRLALRIPGTTIARLSIIPSVDTTVAQVPILARSTLENQLYGTLEWILRARATICAHTLALPASGHGKEVTTCAPG